MPEDQQPTTAQDAASPNGTDSVTAPAAPRKAAAKKAAARPRKAAAKKVVAPPVAEIADPGGTLPAAAADSDPVAAPVKATRTRKAAAKKAAAPAAEPIVEAAAAPPRKRAPRKKAAATAPEPAPVESATPEPAAAPEPSAQPSVTAEATASRPRRRSSRRSATPEVVELPLGEDLSEADAVADANLATELEGEPVTDEPTSEAEAVNETLTPPPVLFVTPAEGTPDVQPAPSRRRRRGASAPAGPPGATDIVELTDLVADPTDAEELAAAADVDPAAAEVVDEPDEVREIAAEEATGARRRRRRGRRGRGSRPASDETDETTEGVTAEDDADEAEDDAAGDEAGVDAEEGGSSSSRRRRRRRRRGSADGEEAGNGDDPPNTVVHVRERDQPQQRSRQESSSDDGVRGVRGSTRLEAKRQRRRDGRDSGRRRPSILTEAEFLARREAVDRVMAVRELGDRTQIAVLEDEVLVEHYVTRASSTSYVGNVYLGRVQNVLPSMEAAFIDIGKGRNGVLYAGEVNWDAAGLEGKSRAIENALSSGDSVLVQVTKDPIGHKGARLTSQVSLPGRFLVYVPGGGMTGISRKLPDTERSRLKAILKKIVPEDAGVIIRTAAEGASEEELTHDVERLKAQWESISTKAAKPKAAPTLVYGEPDLAIRVVRDVFNEDFARLVVQGESAWETVSGYVDDVAPDLAERVSRYTGESDLFHELRVDEQLTKALDRKVFLPSGGSLVIDRTEAMTVIDVNTGKFVGSGGNLEQTVTRNNLEAAEEIVRQLRLRDVGGIVVIDFIDMVLESNRDLVLRRLTECLGRDRTKHQVAEVTSLGLVQMTRKRVGEGLLEAFSETCPTCHGRGVLVHSEPVDQSQSEGGDVDEDRANGSGRRRGKRSGKRGTETAEVEEPPANDEQRRAAASAMALIAGALHHEDGSEEDSEDEVLTDVIVAEVSANGTGPVFEEPDVEEPIAVDDALVALDAEVAEIEEPAAVLSTEADESAGSFTDGQSEAPPSPPRRGRRRAATRPAGPPVGVG
jgi:ribonuclease E